MKLTWYDRIAIAVSVAAGVGVVVAGWLWFLVEFIDWVATQPTEAIICLVFVVIVAAVFRAMYLYLKWVSQ